MISHLNKLIVAGLLSLIVATPLIAEPSVPAKKANSLEELYSFVKQGRADDNAKNKKREAEFKSNRNQQKTMLKNAYSEMKQQEQISAKLEKQYELNDQKIAQTQETLQKRLGNLKELFGHLTGAAGDLREVMNVSVVSAQYPGRTDDIDGLIASMSSSVKLPTIEEIGSLWTHMLHEMTQGGRVEAFKANVILPDGETSEQTVVRIGTFNLASNGKYLSYSPENSSIAELGRQPGGSYLSGLTALQEAKSGVVQAGIDPTGPAGGQFLAALINSPSIIERWHQGGLVGYIISLIGVIAFLIAGWRFAVLSSVSNKVKAQLASAQPSSDNPLGRIMAIYKENENTDNETLEMKLAEGILKERPAIGAYLPMLKIISMVAPLLGLLGTVTGMIITFQAITIFGAGDPKAMAGGISGALVTTVLGLLVAIPTVMLHSIVNSKARIITAVLEEQATGIVAEQSSTAKSLQSNPARLA